MKADLFIIKGKKANLQAARITLDRHVGVFQRVIYPIGRGYRMMVGGILTEEKIKSIVKDDSLSIIKYSEPL